MKKALLFLAILQAAFFCSFSEIVSWKGMELGLDRNPKWLKAWRSKGDERPLRKKFDIEKDKKAIVGFGQADSLESARSASQIDAQGQAEKLLSRGAIRLEPLYEFWQEDDRQGYSVWSLYEL